MIRCKPGLSLPRRGRLRGPLLTRGHFVASEAKQSQKVAFGDCFGTKSLAMTQKEITFDNHYSPELEKPRPVGEFREGNGGNWGQNEEGTCI